ncbi:gibberellin-regulated protein 2-like isoform X3 [Vicia villosa]|uniref:gibberellin-regulated protein 2-like isoform X3 n=1 Tax=Vicia villosa TaxID=3911 RepID=UPI00273B7E99|nr:gibberellin-regulated protein 2-like isoform X3 [Vicia villosa]
MECLKFASSTPSPRSGMFGKQLGSSLLTIDSSAQFFCCKLEIYTGNQHMVAAAGQIDCNDKCNYRCSKASREKICLRACSDCCRICNCVPPGTAGNRDLCPCYASITTHDGKLKCP